MIIDRLKNSEKYYGLGASIEKALRYLEISDLKDKKPGRYDIDGDRIYITISEYETKSSEGVNWEAHRKYIDVQYMISGTEMIGFTSLDNVMTAVEYSDSNDVLFGTASGDYLTVSEGTFIIFMPQDAHMPNIFKDKPQAVKKAVIKIAADGV